MDVCNPSKVQIKMVTQNHCYSQYTIKIQSITIWLQRDMIRS